MLKFTCKQELGIELLHMWEEREWLGKAHTRQLRLYFSPVFWGSQHLLSQGTSAHLHLICSPRDWLSLPKDPSKTPFLQFLISRHTPGPGGPWAASLLRRLMGCMDSEIQIY